MSICFDIVIRPVNGSSPPGLLQTMADELNEVVAAVAGVSAGQRVVERSCVPTAPECTRLSYACGERVCKALYDSPRHCQPIRFSQECAQSGTPVKDGLSLEGGLCRRVPENLRQIACCIARLKGLGVDVNIDVLRRALPDLAEDRVL